MLRGVRGRLTLTIIGLVALTSLVLGVAAYAYVATSLRDQQVEAARDLTNFNVSVLAAERVPPGTARDDRRWKSLVDAFTLRGVTGTVVDFGDGDPFASGLDATSDFRQLSPSLRSIAESGNIGYERLTVDGRSLLVTAARRAPDGPSFYFFFDASEVEGAIQRLGQALVVGGLILVLVAAVVARALARRLLDPVRSAGNAAERMATGDLSARLDVESGDEFGRWAASFNRMAASLEATVAELRAAEARERRFVADVSHELRTPLTALVNEASMLREHLDDVPPGGRRVGELLVADIARLRTLVDDLMEVSRFDAAAMHIDKILDQRQADAEPALALHRRMIALHEQLEDVRQYLGRDANAVIARSDFYHIPEISRRHLQDRLKRGVATLPVALRRRVEAIPEQV